MVIMHIMVYFSNWGFFLVSSLGKSKRSSSKDNDIGLVTKNSPKETKPYAKIIIADITILTIHQ